MSNNAISDQNLSLVGLKQTYSMVFALAASSFPWVFLSFNVMLRYLLEQAQAFNKTWETPQAQNVHKGHDRTKMH